MGNFYNVDHERSQTEPQGKYLKYITLVLHVLHVAGCLQKHKIMIFSSKYGRLEPNPNQ